MKVYARFSSDDAAEAAENEVRSRISGYGSIVRTDSGKSRPQTDTIGTVGAYTDWMFTHNGLYQGGSWLPLAGTASAVPADAAQRGCTVCVEGNQECADRTAHLLRAIGGTDVSITAD